MSIDLKKKPGFNKPLGGDVVFQADGAELSAREIKAKAVAAVSDNPAAEGLKINALDVYAKPAEGMGYYVARHNKGEVTGSFAL